MYRGCCCSQHSSRLLRALSSAAAPPPQQRRANLIFGANTDVGKTLVSAGLVRAALSSQLSVHYIKPLQCGGSDADFVRKYAEQLVVLGDDDTATATTEKCLTTSTMYRWETPSSPHTASLLEDKPCGDEQVLDSLRSALLRDDDFTADVTYIESAGGVLSPSAASPLNRRRGPLAHAVEIDRDGVEWGWSTQGDLYQDLIGMVSSVVLVGDGRLGGISCTLSALESLVLRGYDVAALILIGNHDSTHQNLSAIRSYLRSKRIRLGSGELLFPVPHRCLLALPPIPVDPLVPLDEWFASAEVSNTFGALDMFLHQSWKGEMDDRKAAEQSKRSPLWHGVGDRLEAAKSDRVSIRTAGGTTSRLLDVSNGRWEHGDSTLGLAMAAAQSRYGNHSNEKCTTGPKETLARLFRNRKLVVATDMEAAIRMGIRTYQQRMKASSTTKEIQSIDWIVAGQEDCYHGHSLASLCIAEEYFDRDHPWYQSKSLLLAPPTFGYRAGQLRLEFPNGMDIPSDVSRDFNAIDTVLDVRARSMSKLFSLYKEMIEMQWLVHEHSSHRKIASVVLEPLLLSTTSDTMIKWVDPLWQRAMASIAESRSIPIILDESVTGLYRLGYQSMADLLDVGSADICVYANRSSLFPTNMNFCVTTNEVYDYCKDNDSFSAELSFDASPAECNAAVHVLTTLKQQWSSSRKGKDRLLFTDQHARDLSRLPGVRSAVALGTVLTVTMQCPNDSGDVELASLIAATVKGQGGVVLKQCGASLLAEVGPWTESGVCSSVVDHLQRSIRQTQGKS